MHGAAVPVTQTIEGLSRGGGREDGAGF